MFSKLVFTLAQRKIEFHSHEVVKIAQQMIDNTQTETIQIPDYESHDKVINKVFEDFMDVTMLNYEKALGIPEAINGQDLHEQIVMTIRNPLLFMLKKLYKTNMTSFITEGWYGGPYSSLLKFIESKPKINLLRHEVIFNEKFIVPIHIAGLDSIQKWLFVAKYLADNYRREPVVGWWFVIGGRLILIKNDFQKINAAESVRERCQHFYASDHGLLNHMIRDVKDCLKTFSFDDPDELFSVCKFAMYYERLSLSLKNSLKDKFIHMINHDSNLRDNVEKQQFLLVSLGLPKHLREQAWKVGRIQWPNMIGVKGFDEDDPEFFGSSTFNYNEKSRYVFDLTFEKFHYTTFALVRKYVKEGIECSQNPFYTQIRQVMGGKDANRFILYHVLSQLAKEVNNGSHKPLYRPVHSYGGRDKGDTYHNFAKSIVEYLSLPCSNPRQLAAYMRSVLKDNTVEDERLSFLPNLVSAWFIAEVARNPSSLLTGIMLIDMLENEIRLDENGDNWYSWQNVLIHPRKSRGIGKVKDLYGHNVNIDEFGGSHPMVHNGSVEDTADPLVPKEKLSIARQKEGSLILHWLYMYIQRNRDILGSNYEVNICKAQSSPLSYHPEYDEISQFGKKSDKLDGVCQKIDKFKATIRVKKHQNPDVDTKKEEEKIEKLKVEKDRLMLKQKLQEKILEPCLRKRLSMIDNLLYELEPASQESIESCIKKNQQIISERVDALEKTMHRLRMKFNKASPETLLNYSFIQEELSILFDSFKKIRQEKSKIDEEISILARQSSHNSNSKSPSVSQAQSLLPRCSEAPTRAVAQACSSLPSSLSSSSSSSSAYGSSSSSALLFSSSSDSSYMAQYKATNQKPDKTVIMTSVFQVLNKYHYGLHEGQCINFMEYLYKQLIEKLNDKSVKEIVEEAVNRFNVPSTTLGSIFSRANEILVTQISGTILKLISVKGSDLKFFHEREETVVRSAPVLTGGVTALAKPAQRGFQAVLEFQPQLALTITKSVSSSAAPLVLPRARAVVTPAPVLKRSTQSAKRRMRRQRAAERTAASSAEESRVVAAISVLKEKPASGGQRSSAGVPGAGRGESVKKLPLLLSQEGQAAGRGGQAESSLSRDRSRGFRRKR